MCGGGALGPGIPIDPTCVGGDAEGAICGIMIESAIISSDHTACADPTCVGGGDGGGGTTDPICVGVGGPGSGTYTLVSVTPAQGLSWSQSGSVMGSTMTASALALPSACLSRRRSAWLTLPWKAAGTVTGCRRGTSRLATLCFSKGGQISRRGQTTGAECQPTCAMAAAA